MMTAHMPPVTIPAHLIPKNASPEFMAEVLAVWAELLQEYFENTEDLSTRRHGALSTYRDGCRGPRCRIELRLKKRRLGGHEAQPSLLEMENVTLFLADSIQNSIDIAREEALQNLHKALIIEP